MHVLYSQAEELGCEGKVDESQGVMKLCDQLKAERTELEKVSQNDSWWLIAKCIIFMKLLYRLSYFSFKVNKYYSSDSCFVT